MPAQRCYTPTAAQKQVLHPALPPSPAAMIMERRALPDKKAAPMARPSAQQWMSRPVMAFCGSGAAPEAASCTEYGYCGIQKAAYGAVASASFEDWQLGLRRSARMHRPPPPGKHLWPCR